jgi:hypothetical protein
MPGAKAGHDGKQREKGLMPLAVDSASFRDAKRAAFAGQYRDSLLELFSKTLEKYRPEAHLSCEPVSPDLPVRPLAGYFLERHGEGP